MDQGFWIEMIGYLGSALVLVSMLMRSVVRLRIINLIGSVIFAAYALIIRSYPTALMNICLVLINLYHLYRLNRPVLEFSVYEDRPDSAWVRWLLKRHAEDIAVYFPDFREEDLRPEDTRVFVVMQENEAAGVLIGRKQEDGLAVALDYATPVYRDCSVGKALYARLPEFGVRSLVWPRVLESSRVFLQKTGYELLPDGTARKRL